MHRIIVATKLRNDYEVLNELVIDKYLGITPSSSEVFQVVAGDNKEFQKVEEALSYLYNALNDFDSVLERIQRDSLKDLNKQDNEAARLKPR